MMEYLKCSFLCLVMISLDSTDLSIRHSQIQGQGFQSISHNPFRHFVEDPDVNRIFCVVDAASGRHSNCKGSDSSTQDEFKLDRFFNSLSTDRQSVAPTVSRQRKASSSVRSSFTLRLLQGNTHNDYLKTHTSYQKGNT